MALLVGQMRLVVSPPWEQSGPRRLARRGPVGWFFLQVPLGAGTRGDLAAAVAEQIEHRERWLVSTVGVLLEVQSQVRLILRNISRCSAEGKHLMAVLAVCPPVVSDQGEISRSFELIADRGDVCGQGIAVQGHHRDHVSGVNHALLALRVA
jgi:hypothetical protein